MNPSNFHHNYHEELRKHSNSTLLEKLSYTSSVSPVRRSFPPFHEFLAPGRKSLRAGGGSVSINGKDSSMKNDSSSKRQSSAVKPLVTKASITVKVAATAQDNAASTTKSSDQAEHRDSQDRLRTEEMTSSSVKEERNWRRMPVQKQMQHLLNTGELSDCTFLVGKDDKQAQRIEAHKFPLCRSSEVFQKMFSGELQDQKGEVRISDVTVQVFKIMLRYMYTEKIKFFDVDTALQVTLAAHKYRLLHLVDLCVNFISKIMTPENVCQVFDVADCLYHQNELKKACIMMMKQKTEEVLNADTWVNCSLTFVSTLVQQDTLNVTSELPLLTACQKWAQHHVDAFSKLELGLLVLPHLRLRTLTLEQFVRATLENHIFTSEDIVQILHCIVEPTLKMPLAMCDLCTTRFKP